ncbi:MAG: dihydroneopterin aldolase / 2-amino-4-hydroxy-6-hydroxymethyldihydropteridine diphosphokinase [Actinomycetota bacterium]|nr:dihydroneopterin aldolase / 2-amino-4-hydroxy-6-hydroxymethyldihydropteridine diphosphokinase [Actinomycetota bacterium]
MTAVLSIGSNLGDRLAALQTAVDILDPMTVSPVYETAPVGGPSQPSYLNAVVICDLDAATAWERAQRAEQALGRERTVRWGPRTLDVDLIVADGVPPSGIVLPHPRAHERAFVLLPWHDADPDAVVPGHGRVADLLAAVGSTGVDKREELQLMSHHRSTEES